MDTTKLQGVGLGLRSCHYSYIEMEKPNIAWFEVLADNYFSASGMSARHLEKIAGLYPITLHSSGLSLGSVDPLNVPYLTQLKNLIQRTQPLLVSDHLSWTSFEQQYFHDLLPLPFTEEAVFHTAKRIQAVQEFLGCQIMIENIASYLTFKHSTLQEWEFLRAVADEADCLILLDITNIYINAYNNGFYATEYIAKLNTDRIAQFHLAGFQHQDTYLLDTHGSPVQAPVWELFKLAIEKFGRIPTVIEWDHHIPAFGDLMKQVQLTQQIMDDYADIRTPAEEICAWAE